jgi:hypothetical protein
MPWLTEALGYALIMPLLLGGPSPFTFTARMCVFLAVFIFGCLSDTALWKPRIRRSARQESTSRLLPQFARAAMFVAFYLWAGSVFGLVLALELPKFFVVASVITAAKYLLFQLQDIGNQ